MITKSILKNLTNCTITDRSSKQICDNAKDSNPTTSILSNTTTISEEGHRFTASEIVIGDDNDQNMNHNNKKLKISKDNAAVTSKDNYSTITTNETTAVQASQVWQHAERCPNSNYSICLLCPDNKKISANNGSTSTLRKHLISKHQVHELALPNNKRKRIIASMDIKKTHQLNELFIKCVVRDGRTFNDLQKPGMKYVLQQIIPG